MPSLAEKNDTKNANELASSGIYFCITGFSDGKRTGFVVRNPDSDAAMKLVMSLNLHRRHLSETQREVIAAKFANLCGGRPAKETGQSCPVSKSNDEAAEQLNVKPRSVKNAKSAIKGGCPELVQAMERDEVTSSLAAKLVAAVPSKAKQAEIAKNPTI